VEVKSIKNLVYPDWIFKKKPFYYVSSNMKEEICLTTINEIPAEEVPATVRYYLPTVRDELKA